MPAKPAPAADLGSLRALLNLLRRERELVEIETEVDPDQEVAEIHRRVIAAAGPALYFKRPKGSCFPVVTNLFGTPRRVEMAFGPRPREVIRGLVDLVHSGGPPDLMTLWRSRSLVAQALRLGTKRKSSGPIQEVIETDPDLFSLPVIKTWPEDGGPFFTLPLVLTRDPKTQVPNLGIYRMQRHDATTTGMHWQIGKGGGFHHWTARELGQSLPVSVFLGGPPALFLSAIAPLPEGIPELLLTGLLLGRKLPVLEDKASGHPIPAEAEFALLGESPPIETHPEGPFGDHYGYYSLTHDYPIFRCHRMLRRRDAIYPATVVGKPRQEDFYLGDYIQELLSPLFPVVMPSVVDLWSYGETGFHSLSGAVVKDRY
ncbi:MAG: UbiD family decarboxylase, partial [Candidatus Omnitrophica bacterium]|nr:UbiD family decarboxylase [Candidatus Omnitrophota bacterium]